MVKAMISNQNIPEYFKINDSEAQLKYIMQKLGGTYQAGKSHYPRTRAIIQKQ